MTLDVIEIRYCSICSQGRSGPPEYFKGWIMIREPLHENSTDYHNYNMCETCQKLIRECINHS